MSSEIDKLLVNGFFAANEMTSSFDKDIFAPKSIDQKLRVIRRILGSARVSRAGDDVSWSRTFGRLFRRDAESPSRTGVCMRDACATQQCNKPFRKLRQLTPSHCAFPFFAPQM